MLLSPSAATPVSRLSQQAEEALHLASPPHPVGNKAAALLASAEHEAGAAAVCGLRAAAPHTPRERSPLSPQRSPGRSADCQGRSSTSPHRPTRLGQLRVRQREEHGMSITPEQPSQLATPYYSMSAPNGRPATVGLTLWSGRKEEDRAVVGEEGRVLGVFDGHLGVAMAQFASDSFVSKLRSAAQVAGAVCGESGDEGVAGWTHVESEAAAIKILSAAFRESHEAARALRLRGGTTALVFWSCLLPGGRKAGFCANAGDSRAVISRAGGIAQRLSVDHTADVQEEVARVESVGGSCALGLLVDPKDGGLPSAWTSMSVSQCNALPSRR